MYRIARAHANADFSLDLRFSDGKEAKVDLSELVASAPIASPFRDPSRFVSDLKIVEEGDVLRWSEQF